MLLGLTTNEMGGDVGQYDGQYQARNDRALKGIQWIHVVSPNLFKVRFM